MLGSRKVCPAWELLSDGNQCLSYELEMALSSDFWREGVKADAVIVSCVLLTLRHVREERKETWG